MHANGIDSRDRRSDGKVTTISAVKNRAKKLAMSMVGICPNCRVTPIATGQKTCHACNDKAILAGVRLAVRKALKAVGLSDFEQLAFDIQASDLPQLTKNGLQTLLEENKLQRRYNPHALSDERITQIRDARASMRFTIKEIADRFHVSESTVLRHSINPKKKLRLVG